MQLQMARFPFGGRGSILSHTRQFQNLVLALCSSITPDDAQTHMLCRNGTEVVLGQGKHFNLVLSLPHRILFYDNKIPLHPYYMYYMSFGHLDFFHIVATINVVFRTQSWMHVYLALMILLSSDILRTARSNGVHYVLNF